MADKLSVNKENEDFAIETVEMHTGGEPLRIIRKGYPKVDGKTILEKRRFLRENLDSYRTMLMHEPRGHSDMYGALIVPPDHPDADIGVIFMHNEGYSTMCGHAVIALGRYAVDYGYVKAIVPETIVRIQCPCGLVEAHVECSPTGKSGSVHFESVPSFCFATNQEVTLEKYGRIVYDVSFGGTFYALVDAKYLGFELNSAPEAKVREAGKAVTDHLRKFIKLEHPESSDLAFLYGTIITDGQDDFNKYQETMNVCVFGDGQVDRSPTGSGVQARLALQFHKGLITLGQRKTFINPLTNSKFVGQVLKEVKCGEFGGVVVEVAGNAFYCGTAKFWQEENDSLRNGFCLH